MSVLYIDSNNFPDQDPCNLTVDFGNAIHLPGTWSMGLKMLETWHTHYNISVANKNNKFQYIPKGSTDIFEVVFDDGIYDLTLLNRRVQSFIHVNGHTTFTGSGEPIYGVVFIPDYNTGQNTMYLGEDWKVKFDFTFNMGSMLGFNESVFVGAVGGSIFTSDFIGDMNVGVVSWQVRTDAITDSYANGERESILFNFTPNAPPYHAIKEEPKNVMYSRLRLNNLKELKLQLTDQDGRQLNLNGNDIQYTLLLKKGV